MKRSLILCLAGLALLVAGCGSTSSPSSVASVETTTTTTASSTTASTQAGALVAFSQCMRTNGVPSFPDPAAYVHANVKLTIQADESTNPHFRTAMNVCGHLLPAGRRSQQTAQQQRVQLADELSFARCMRSHGVSRFPDPNGQGQLSVAMVQAQGVDIHSPQVLHVVQTCIPASHGALTLAKINEALKNASGG